MSDTAILNILKMTAKKIFPYGGGVAYLYGSRARGEARTGSDWDILIVTDNAADNDENYRKYAFPFAEIGWHTGEQITPILYSKSDWDNQKGSLFYENVLTDAIIL